MDPGASANVDAKASEAVIGRDSLAPPTHWASKQRQPVVVGKAAGGSALQEVKLECRKCKQTETVSFLRNKAPKCSNCGHQLPNRAFKRRQTPEIKMLTGVLEGC